MKYSKKSFLRAGGIMKIYIWALLMLLVLSCSSSKDIITENNRPEFEIVKTPLIVEGTTSSVNELRFYKIQSALDGMKLMYLSYGKWTKKAQGKHQQNINRIIWSNVELIRGENEKFTVIADGAETGTDYFACLIVYDSEGNNCFEAGHPNREKLTVLFSEKMKNMDKNSSLYKLFR